MLHICICVHHESAHTRLQICVFMFSLLFLLLKITTSLYLSPILRFNQVDLLHLQSPLVQG